MIIIIESILELYTMTSEKLYYQIVLTDFNKKREIEIISDESCGLSEMDTMEAVHGIFSKQTITINMIPTKKVNRNKILFSFITRFAVISITLYKSYTVLIDYKEYSSSYKYNDDYNYEEDDPYLNSQKEENIVDILPKDKKYYNKMKKKVVKM